jgi:hypothetical protein
VSRDEYVAWAGVVEVHRGAGAAVLIPQLRRRRAGHHLIAERADLGRDHSDIKTEGLELTPQLREGLGDARRRRRRPQEYAAASALGRQHGCGGREQRRVDVDVQRRRLRRTQHGEDGRRVGGVHDGSVL